MKRILVIRGGAIGDFVLTLPAIRLLRDRFPHAHLEILGYKHIVALAENRGYANATRSIESAALASFFARAAALPSDLADYFSGFDLILSYLFDPDQVFEENLKRCGAENLVIGPAKIVAAPTHAAQQLMQPLNELGLRSDWIAAQIFPSDADREVARKFFGEGRREVVAVHLGSGSEIKNWPIQNWVQLLASHTDKRADLLLVSGEADERRTNYVRDRIRDRPFLEARGLPLPHLAAVLESCALFVGHDSGISHIATAVGTQCLLLFGPTDPRVWAPAGDNVRVLRAPGENLGGLTVVEVERALGVCSRATN